MSITPYLTTPKGLPYPPASDPVAQGAAAIQALAAAVDAASNYLIADSGALAAAQANIDFVSIPQTFRHLRLICWLRSNTTSAGVARLMCNGDTVAGNYAEASTSGTALGGWFSGSLVISTVAAGFYTVLDSTIFDYTGATRFKTWIGTWIQQNVGGTWSGTSPGGAVWESNAPINRLTISPNTNLLGIGSRAMLFGVHS